MALYTNGIERFRTVDGSPAAIPFDRDLL